jgi:hypothetical protein
MVDAILETAVCSKFRFELFRLSLSEIVNSRTE